MPKFLEKKLKAEYGQNSKIPYKVMNSIGAMHGNKETAKGAAMQKKHDAVTSTVQGYDFSRPKRQFVKRTSK